MAISESGSHTESDTAVKACEKSIEWFTKNKRTARNLYYTSQLLTIILSALTPVLILVDPPFSKWIQALPAALAAIAAASTNVFNWKEHWIRRSSTLEQLIAELLKYETRTSPAYDIKLGEHERLNNFVETTTRLNLMEVSSWGKAVGKIAEKEF